VVLKKILVLGAGRSSIYLIEYLLKHAEHNGWQVTIADLYEAAAKQKAGDSPVARAIGLDLKDAAALRNEVAAADVVVSLMPADMHIHVAQLCLELSKSMFTASYISDAMKAMEEEVAAKGLLFLNEIGCDPGIDHMSTMELIDGIRAKGGVIKALYSYTGGLVARDCDTNPWHYKFSWNPRNVVMAAQPGPARYLANDYIRFKPYNRIFREFESVEVPDFGPLDAYANRDSLPYKDYYDLASAHTILRATFRYPDFCQGWAILVFLGLTNDQLQLQNCDQLNYRDFLNMFLPPDDSFTVREGFERLLRERMNLDEAQIATTLVQFDYLDFFSDSKFKRTNGSPADLLLEMLERKWQLAPGDRDLIVMHHRLDYELAGQIKSETSTLLLEGENENYTAMAKTVGLPLAISVRLFLEEKLPLKGVLIPTHKALYEPIMEELKKYGVQFK
jgi:saccharopine dehydrogenase-like NADP-dependent oxidoreductase